MELAEQVSQRLLSPTQESIDAFLCRALRGEPAPWDDCSGVSSTEFLERCHHHGVAALLFHELHQQATWASWPPAVRLALENASRAGVAQELLSTHHLRQLLLRFNELEIPCLLMKGEALALSLYGHPGTRVRSDSDLFIPVRDIAKVRDAVIDLGYEVVSPVFKSHQFTVMRPGDTSGNVRFDIHWRILNAPRFARTLSFEESLCNSVEVPGIEGVRMLCNIDALLVACMHRLGSARHDADRLIWLYDIHALSSGMDLEESLRFAAKAVDRNVQDACLDGLLAAHAAFCSQWPEPAGELLREPTRPTSRSGRLTQSQWSLLLEDWKDLSAHDRGELLKELLLPPADDLLGKYGKKSRMWLPLLYIRRAIHGVRPG